jgi:SulP family sulfate permease
LPRFLPKSIVCLREGYTRQQVLRDLVAGLTVGVIALPLAIAFGIASIPQSVIDAGRAQGVLISPPAMGLFTAVVAGFLISALGGSRVQIGGPTGAFIVIVYDIASRHGYDGLAVATAMAGVIVIIMGLARFGAMIKFIPYPVITGFTSGIAVIIATSQVKDFFGLKMGAVPADFVHKLQALAENYATWTPPAFGVGAGALLVILLLRRFAPRVPAYIVAVLLASAAVWAFNLPVETIATRFGGIPRMLPVPRVPHVEWSMIQELVPSATTIAILAAIESLLSAVVADGMLGTRHKADCELVALGTANVASVLFGGIPATGAIARTATSIKSGGRTPLAGMVHAVTLLLCMVLLGPLAGRIPLACLAAVLLVVAWNMSEIDHFRYILRAPYSDIAVLLTTFGLTVFTDLTIAVGVGMVLASLLFMKRMADVSGVSAVKQELAGEEDESDELAARKDPNAIARREVPAGVEVYEVNGPLFFGVADRLKDILSHIEPAPRVFILRMRRVPAIDATGLHALEEFLFKCRRQHTRLLLAGVHAQPLFAFMQAGFVEKVGRENMFENIDAALARARAILGLPPVERPRDAQPEVARERAAPERSATAAAAPAGEPKDLTAAPKA